MKLFGRSIRTGHRTHRPGRGKLDTIVERTARGLIVRGTVSGRPGRVEVLRLPVPPVFLMNNWQSWGPTQKVRSDVRFPELERIYADYSPHVFSPLPEVLRRGLVSDYWVACEDMLLGFLSSRVAHPFFTIEGGDIVGWLEFFDTTFDQVVPLEPLVTLSGGPVEDLLTAYGRLLKKENRVRLPRGRGRGSPRLEPDLHHHPGRRLQHRRRAGGRRVGGAGGRLHVHERPGRPPDQRRLR